ncbi:MAG: hypothetical protein IPJ26_15895 [Bacteroidetes bacterium]|jgi:hypothetical protein|nr:hypothetical protein [Bacteroidota bacterium]
MEDLELEDSIQRMKNVVEDGEKNILKYFDRINDKLFNFNNVLIAGYFALSKITDSISSFYILIPITNMCFLFYIEYKMMEKSRFEAKLMKKSQNDVANYHKMISKANYYSLLAIISTVLVTVVFLWNLIIKR